MPAPYVAPQVSPTIVEGGAPQMPGMAGGGAGDFSAGAVPNPYGASPNPFAPPQAADPYGAPAPMYGAPPAPQA